MITYREMVDAMIAFSKLPLLEREIIELLDKREQLTDYADFYGTFKDLTLALGRPKSHISNVCKAYHSLNSKGLVFKTTDEGKPVFFLNDPWIEYLVKGGWL